jgi:hypothetical protein
MRIIEHFDNGLVSTRNTITVNVEGWSADGAETRCEPVQVWGGGSNRCPHPAGRPTMLHFQHATIDG